MTFKRRVAETLTNLGIIEVANELVGLTTLAKPRVLIGNARFRMKGGENGVPLPPSRLIYLVAGTYEIQWFLKLGREGYHAILDTLKRNGIEFSGIKALLDFGCGCGRVIRFFSSAEAIEVHGCDYNRRLVDWCAGHLTFAKFAANQLSPPLPYGDHSFDLVYAFSVFTHLGEELQYAWIDEMRRVIRPGGHLLMTAHGESYLPRLSEPERERFNSRELVIRRNHLAGKNICNSFCTDTWVRSHLTRGCEVVDFVPQGAKGNPTQDLYLLRFE